MRILGSEAYEYLDQGPIVTAEEKRSKASCCVPIGSAEESTEVKRTERVPKPNQSGIAEEWTEGDVHRGKTAVESDHLRGQ